MMKTQYWDFSLRFPFNFYLELVSIFLKFHNPSLFWGEISGAYLFYFRSVPKRKVVILVTGNAKSAPIVSIVTGTQFDLSVLLANVSGYDIGYQAENIPHNMNLT